MIKGQRAQRARAAGRVAALVAVAVMLPFSARAHVGTGKVRATCAVTIVGTRATMEVEVANLWTEEIRNVTPSDLLTYASGTARYTLGTEPRALRSLQAGRKATFTWDGRVAGDGLLDLSVEIFADFLDGHTETTGIVNCNRVTIGTGGVPTATSTRPPVPTRTNTIRPTRTPIPARPTRTVRLEPTRTPTRAVPTSTPTRPTATRTRTPTQPRATRTPIAVPPTRTPNRPPTRTPIRARTATATFAAMSPTPSGPRGTHTATPRVTRTLPGAPTGRPTRTPVVNGGTPTRTPTYGPGPINDGLRASCSLRRNIDLVTVTMLVENQTGTDLADIRGSQLQLQPEGGSLIFDRAGPSPSNVRQLRKGRSVTIQWTGRLSAGGTMGFSAFVSANSPSGPVNSRMIDCGVTGPGMSSFDATAFTGTCKVHPGPDGDMVIEVRNGTTETLTNVEAFMMGRTATGNVQLSLVRGPAPRNVRSLSPGARRDFTFTGRFLGEGDITMTFEARGSRVTEQRVVTAPIVCSAPVGGTPDSLPDLGVDQDDLRQSTMITTEDFDADHCAVVEGCVDGIGARRLLRFNTTTPNYGPGDAFIGDPRNNPDMQYSACHNHYHFKEYADYRLLDRLGNIVARGHKQAFCLVDLWAPPGLNGAARAQFTHCGFQGISAGWADVYHRGLDCQWIDITGVPSGRYVLEVEVNPARALRELDYSNNVARTEVLVP